MPGRGLLGLLLVGYEKGWVWPVNRYTYTWGVASYKYSVCVCVQLIGTHAHGMPSIECTHTTREYICTHTM